MDKRISTRAFLRDKPVSRDTIEEILTLASRAPSGGNTQPWHIYVVAGSVLNDFTSTVKSKLCAGSAGMYKEFDIYPPKDKAPASFMGRRIKVAKDMWALQGVDRKDAAARARALLQNYEFFGAPVGMIVTVDRSVDRNGWGHVGMLLQSLCLLAEERGLATCLQEAWGNLGNVVYSALGIPESEIIWCGVALGYADPSSSVNRLRTEREPLSEFTKFRGFPQDTSKL